MSLRKSLTKAASTVVQIPKQSNVTVCRNFLVPLPKGKVDQTRSMKSAFTKSLASRIVRACMPAGSPMPTVILGEGGFGRVYGLDDNKHVLKLQVFELNERSLNSQTGEMFLGRLFGMNGIGPRVLRGGFLFTNRPGIAVSFIVMQKGEGLSKVLKRSNKNMKKKIMKHAQSQYITALNRMLTLGFACVDLKPSNTLFNVDTGKLSLIDFSLNLCPAVPVVLEKLSKKISANKLGSKLPIRVRRDVIASQLIFFHVTCKVFNRVEFARPLIDKILQTEATLNNAHKFLCLGRVPDDFFHVTNNKEINDGLHQFLFSFARQARHNFAHYAQLDKIGNSMESFASLLAARVS